jgi:DNA-binding response OmpR family regulator
MKTIALGNLELDRNRFEVRVDGEPIDLSYIQFEVLYQLATRAEKVVDRDQLVRAIWGDQAGEDARKLRIQISRLRKKIAGSRPWQIKTVTKRGYALVNTEARARLPAFVLTHAPVRRSTLGEGGAL